jgi:ATP-dependent RNA helicase DOB1
MLFNGLFNTLSPPVVAALLSCFVFDAERKAKDGAADATAALPPALMRELGPALRTMQSLARRVATVMQECRIEISPEEYVSKFSPAMANVVFQWATGAKFVEICKLTAVFEGAVIRCMRRLEEVLRQLMQASKVRCVSFSFDFLTFAGNWQCASGAKVCCGDCGDQARHCV